MHWPLTLNDSLEPLLQNASRNDLRDDEQNSVPQCPLLLLKATVLVLLLSLVACDRGGSTGSDDQAVVQTLENPGAQELFVPQPALVWEPCENDRTIECASLQVPMDYSNPGSEQISIAIARASFADLSSSNPRAILTNPGGPGAGGIDVLSAFMNVGQFPDDIRQNVQFISFDPRGLGDSTPVSCNFNALLGIDRYALSQEDIESNLEFQGSFARGCFDRHGSYLQQLGSLNVVRDMNEIRKALQLDTIDFLGYSYGTRLGALFLQEYPQHSGRFVLDGSVSTAPDIEPLFAAGMVVADENLTRMIASCQLVSRSCDPVQISAQLLSAMESLGTGRPTNDLFILSSFLQIASTQPGFEETLVSALLDYLEFGDINDLTRGLIRVGRESGADVHQAAPGINGTTYTAVLCADDPFRPTSASVMRLAADLNALSDLLAETYLPTMAICSGWPETIEPLPVIATSQAPVSLVIGGPTDAQTPLKFSADMALALGGQFLRSEHQGHTVAFRGANACTDAAVTDFFVTGVLPTVSVCEDDTSIFMSDSWSPSLPLLPAQMR